MSVSAMAEESEISVTEDNGPPWKQRKSKFEHPFSKAWYAECAMDKSGRTDCKI